MKTELIAKMVQNKGEIAAVTNIAKYFGKLPEDTRRMLPTVLLKLAEDKDGAEVVANVFSFQKFLMGWLKIQGIGYLGQWLKPLVAIHRLV